jgi:2-polyprenyl-6-methoxyphenol hydroxylase-like FAD-dependent oxidoreductase
MAQDHSYGHAVVAGGSMAGLLVASVLAKHFTQVTVVERDLLPVEAGAHRRGVQQSKHVHALLAAGLQAMEKLMPGLTASLTAEGGVTINGDEVPLILDGHRAQPTQIGVPLLLAGRSLIESRVRDWVRGISNVSLQEGQEVGGVILNDANDRITGVRVAPADDPSGQTVLEADLVVDATGRGARSAAWFRDAGLALPEEDETTIRIVYATRRFRRRGGELGGDKGILITPTVDNLRGGVMHAQENGTWLVTLFGYLGEESPLELGGFKEFAGALATQDIYDALATAEPVDEAALIRYPASRRRHYETLEGLPEGYLTVGDSLCSFNPIYGQGITVAALESEILDVVLRERDGRPLVEGSGLARDFYGHVTPLLDLAWATSVGSDLRYPEVEGDRTPEVTQANAFMSQVYLAASRDVEVSRSLTRVINLLDGPDVLGDPSFVERVQRAASQEV